MFPISQETFPDDKKCEDVQKGCFFVIANAMRVHWIALLRTSQLLAMTNCHFFLMKNYALSTAWENVPTTKSAFLPDRDGVLFRSP
jgi:hypothetical protein